MSDPNPYEPPRDPEPLTKVQLVKRGIGAGIILLLTPVAVIITGVASCAAAQAYGNAVFAEQMPNLAWNVLIGCTIAFAPPVIILIAMLWWAVRRAAEQPPQNRID